MILMLSACGADTSEATPTATAATGSHTGSAAAAHMQLKNLSTGAIVCKAHDNTPATTRPTAHNCPSGTWTEQLFDVNWGQIGKNKTVTVGSTTTPDPVNPPNSGEAPLRNPNRAFYQYENIPSDDLDFNSDDLTVEDGDYLDIEIEDDGEDFRDGAGNFRVTCQYSHFAKDDPILKPGDFGESHLHMFFGKTNTDANTNTNTNKDDVAESGGGTCNGFALNRSAYWTPALLDGPDTAIIPKQIIVYYKSARVNDYGVDYMPQGLELLGGNIKNSDGWLNKSPYDVFWSCGENGSSRKDETRSDNLEELEGKNCGRNEPINATIYFPQCVARENPNLKKNEGNVKLSSDDDSGYSHTYRLSIEDDERGKAGVSGTCPNGPNNSYPVRIPELAILLYYPSLNELNRTSLEGLKLSSDEGATPGSTLHADWIGGWQDETMKKWVDNCNQAKKNCTFGETGTKRRLKRALNEDSSYAPHREGCVKKNDDDEIPDECNSDEWRGPYFLTLPERLQ